MEMGQCCDKAHTQKIENQNRAASRLYHKNDCLCQAGNNNSGQMGIKKPPGLMFDVLGAGAVNRRPRMFCSLKNYNSGESGLTLPGINAFNTQRLINHFVR
jgi:hypothetical protein